MKTGVIFCVKGHEIKVDQRVVSEVLYIDGKLADKVKGFFATHTRDADLYGTIQNADGSLNTIRVHISNGLFTEKITVFCDNQKVNTEYMI